MSTTTNPLASIPDFVIRKVQPSVKRLANIRAEWQGWARIGCLHRPRVRETLLAAAQPHVANVFQFRALCAPKGIDADAAIAAMEAA